MATRAMWPPCKFLALLAHWTGLSVIEAGGQPARAKCAVQGGRQLWLASASAAAAAAGFPRSLGPHGVVVFPAEIPDPSLARFDYRSPYRHRRIRM